MREVKEKSGARTATNTVGITYLSDYYSNGLNSREFRSSEGQPRYMFQGMEWDIETQTYNTLYRFYSPEYGRWWSPDPIVQPWQSTYSAMDGNPVFFTDPFGLKARKNAEPPTIKGTDGQEAYGTKGPIRDESEIKFQYSEKNKGWMEVYSDAVSVAPKNNFQLTKTIAFTNVSNSVRSPRIVANKAETPWMNTAINEYNAGVKEVPKGSNSGPKVDVYLKYAGVSSPNAWCASFAHWCFGQNGIKGAGAKGSNWSTWGQELSKPSYGAVAVFTTGHVGFVAGNKGSNLVILHGNWSDKVTYSDYIKPDQIKHYRYPTEYTPSYNMPSW